MTAAGGAPCRYLPPPISARPAADPSKIASIAAGRAATATQPAVQQPGDNAWRQPLIRPAIDRYWCLYAFDPLAPLILEPGYGCDCQLVLDDVPPIGIDEKTSYKLVAAELRLDKPLPAGNLHTFSFTLRYQPNPADLTLPTREFRRVVTSPATRDLQLKISFDPTNRPIDLRQATWRREPVTRPPIATEAVTLHDDGAAQPLHLTNPAPLGYGYVWNWSTEEQAVP